MQDKLEVFSQIYTNILSNNRKRAYSGDTGKSSYVLQATPAINDTWHELPMADSSSGVTEGSEISNWIKHKDHFPTIKSTGPANVVPCDLSEGFAKDMMPKGVNVSFSNYDKNFENFLAAPSLVRDSKVNIEGAYCQGPSQVRVKVDKNVVRSEKLSRHGIREGHGVIFMLELLSERLEKALKPDCEWDPRIELRLVSEWLELIKVNAFRANSFTSSIQVLMKDLIREKTLESLNGSVETKKELRHSHYATHKIFGPLSASFEPFVHPSSHSHRKYLLFPKRGNYDKTKSGSGYGDFNNSGFSGQQKRAADPSWNMSRNKMTRQSSGYVKAISPQEVLNRAKGAQNSQQGFFREYQGRGSKNNRNFRKGYRR